MRQHVEFRSYESAVAFCDDLEARGEESYSIMTNAPRPGRWTVNYGTQEEDGMLPCDLLAKAMEERQAMADVDRETRIFAIGRRKAAAQAAAQAGFDGRDGEVFVAGFCGAYAKIVNPRAENREHIFRAGRKAYGTARWQQAARAAAAAARKDVPREYAQPINVGGLIANGEYD